MELKQKAPLYHKVYGYLLGKIEKDCSPGDLLPTQSEIAATTGTSLITVKRAIKELEAAGYLESKAGKGTIVRKPPVVDNHVGVSSWTDSITEQGKMPSTAWTTIKKNVPNVTIANELRLKPNEIAVRIKRLRLIDGEPICLMANEIPLRLVPDLDDKATIDESLYTYLKNRYGLIPVSAEEEVYARQATEYEIKMLRLKTPIVLVIKRLSFLLDNIPFEISSVIASADSYVYRSRQINRTLDPEVLQDLLTKTN